MGKITVCPHPVDTVSTSNWVFEYQPIASQTLTQLSRYKRAESHLLADEKEQPPPPPTGTR